MFKLAFVGWAYVVHKLRSACVQLMVLRTTNDGSWQWPVCNVLVVPRVDHSPPMTCTTTIRVAWTKLMGVLYPSSTGPIRTTTKYINLILVIPEGAIAL